MFTDFGANLSGANGSLHLVGNGQFALFETLAAYDGAGDFAGESGERLSTDRDTDANAAQLFGKSLEGFLKNAKTDSMQFTVIGGASSSWRQHQVGQRGLPNRCPTCGRASFLTHCSAIHHSAFGRLMHLS